MRRITMDNIEKNIAQGYADFTDDSEVTAEAGGNASFNLTRSSTKDVYIIYRLAYSSKQ